MEVRPCVRCRPAPGQAGVHARFAETVVRTHTQKTTLRSSGQAVWGTRKTDAGKMPFETPSRLLRSSGQVGTSLGKRVCRPPPPSMRESACWAARGFDANLYAFRFPGL